MATPDELVESKRTPSRRRSGQTRALVRTPANQHRGLRSRDRRWAAPVSDDNTPGTVAAKARSARCARPVRHPHHRGRRGYGTPHRGDRRQTLESALSRALAPRGLQGSADAVDDRHARPFLLAEDGTRVGMLECKNPAKRRVGREGYFAIFRSSTATRPITRCKSSDSARITSPRTSTGTCASTRSRTILSLPKRWWVQRAFWCDHVLPARARIRTSSAPRRKIPRLKEPGASKRSPWSSTSRRPRSTSPTHGCCTPKQAPS